MGREIKFRAFDKEDNHMLKPDSVAVAPNNGRFPTWSISGEGITIRHDSERFALMQFTGLTDRNFAGEKPEFWAYFADYDWVVLCQLFGRMVDLPGQWPMFCMDVQQLIVQTGIKKIPGHYGAPHNALDDAIWCKRVYEFICDGI